MYEWHVFLCILACTIVLYLAYKFIKVRLLFGIANSENVYFKQKIQELEEERLIYLKRIQELETTINITNKAREEAQISSNASVLEIAQTISQNLLESYKQETKFMREATQENMNTVMDKFQCDFIKISNHVYALGDGVEKSILAVNDIKQSLRSPNAIGSLGEITMENILKNAGLRVGIDYIIQPIISEQKVRPDAIVLLPNDNVIVIDAKSSKFLLEINTNGTEQDFMKSMNMHLRDLVAKNYKQIISEHYQGKNIIILMFFPTESYIDHIANIDRSFLNKSWSQDIFPVGPVSLVNTLALAKLEINNHIKHQNYQSILSEISSFVNSMHEVFNTCKKLGTSVQTLVGSYNNFISSFNEQIVYKVHNMSNYGIGNSKNITLLPKYKLFVGQQE